MVYANVVTEKYALYVVSIEILWYGHCDHYLLTSFLNTSMTNKSTVASVVNDELVNWVVDLNAHLAV
eukprot:CAMPEP_0175028240 /NCGR_PEP_ID=MMETSP0005-20121125/18874_1 /TAXON_ID=420556 /ORGANISM="Ochromonas sp., Strain CCMP1393" /LENGTH=66 /DNA_ID=CAMNT_0016287805 /DNA_START=117 /DNA_END=317 /DNA_ORIENTATION=-